MCLRLGEGEQYMPLLDAATGQSHSFPLWPFGDWFGYFGVSVAPWTLALTLSDP